MSVTFAKCPVVAIGFLTRPFVDLSLCTKYPFREVSLHFFEYRSCEATNAKDMERLCVFLHVYDLRLSVCVYFVLITKELSY